MARDEHELRVEVLGPLRLRVDGVDVEVPGPRRRALLALLALAGGRPLSVDELLDAVWPGEIPESGRRALHSHLSRLRGHLGAHAARLVRVGQAYRLDLRPGELDATDAALTPAAWRGTALEEFADVAPLAVEAAALAELRLDLQDRWLEARLSAGGDADLVADATRAVATAPLRERTTLALVQALAAEGRQAEALRAANDLRRRLVEETGLDPSSRFDDVERAIVAGDGGHARRAVARPASPFVGRDAEVALVHRRIAESRLVTVVGAGGAGKTRLALEAAADLAERGSEVFVVHLADAGVTEAAATAFGVHAPTGEAVLAAISSVLAGRDTVVVLDNCEHVLDESRALAIDLLSSDAAVRILVTSREPLGVDSEHLVRLGPLPVPTEGSDPRGAPAYEAFLAHARRRSPGYEPVGEDVAAIGEVVRRLDGLPLAVELAAGRVGTFSERDLAARLGRALDVLGSHSDRRHGTLRSAIDWSYRLLSDDEQRLLRTVALLPDGFDLETTEQLAVAVGVTTEPAAALARLVDASVVVADLPRYRLLETIRAYALDQLDVAGDRDAAEAAVVTWGVATAAAIEAEVNGGDESAADRRFRAEAANLSRALSLAAERGDVEAEIDIVGGLHEVITYRGLPELAAATFGVADRARAADHPRRAVALAAAAQAAWLRGDLDDAERLSTDALDATPTDLARNRSLSSLGTVALFRSRLAESRRLFEEAATVPPIREIHLCTAALAAIYAGDRDGARALVDEAFALVEEARPTAGRAFACYALGELESTGEPDAAVAAYTESIAVARVIGASFIEGVATVGLVAVWGRRGMLAEAFEGYRWLVDHWRRHANWVQLWTTLRNLASALADAGDADNALFVLAAAEHAPEAALIDDATSSDHATLRARVESALGPDETARVLARAASLPRARVVDEAIAAVEHARSR